MPLLELQVLFRRGLKTDAETLFGWKALPSSIAKSYKLYHSHDSDGPFLLLRDGIVNQPSIDAPYKGKILLQVIDSTVPILAGEDHYFKLTYIDKFNVESSLDAAPIKLVHPPQIDQLDLGQDTDNYVYNFCWDEVNHRWVKGRAAVKSQYVNVTATAAEQSVTFDQDLIVLEVQNNSMFDAITLNLNGDSIAANGGLIIDPKQYYTAGRAIRGNIGVTVVSNGGNASVTFVGHF